MVTGGSKAARSRRRRLVAAAAAGALALTGTTFVGGGVASAQAARGRPVKLMFIAPIRTPLQDWEVIGNGATAAAKSINKAGGLQGRPIEIEMCNDNGNANGALACARKAASGGYLATVANQTSFGAVVNPVLTSAKVPAVGHVARDRNDWDSPASFPYAQSSTWTGNMITAIDQGAKNPGILYIDVAGVPPLVDAMKDAAEKNRIPIAKIVSISAIASDLSSPVQSLKSARADAIIAISSTPQTLSVMRALRQLNYDVPVYVSGGSIGPDGFKAMGELAKGLRMADYAPTPTATDRYPSLRQFSKDMADAGLRKTKNATSTSAVFGWLGVHAVKASVDKLMVGKPLTSEEYWDALTNNRRQKINIAGIFPDWITGKKGPSGYGRMRSTTMFLSRVADDKGTIELLRTIDVYRGLGLKVTG